MVTIDRVKQLEAEIRELQSRVTNLEAKSLDDEPKDFCERVYAAIELGRSLGRQFPHHTH